MEQKRSEVEIEVEALIGELGDGAVEDLRSAAMTEIMPRVAAQLRSLSTPMAEAIIAQVLWYLAEREHADPRRVLKLLHLCTAGAKLGMSEGWLLGPKAQA